MNEHSQDEEPKPRKRRRKTKPDSTVEESESTDEPAQVIGKRLTVAQKEQMINKIRTGLLSGLHPDTVKQGCIKMYKVSRETVDRQVAAVRREMMGGTGFFRSQAQFITQQLMFKVANNESEPTRERLKACSMLDNIFDLKVRDEDTDEAEKNAVEDAMERMEKMTIQELTEFTHQLRYNKLTANDFFGSPKKAEPNSPEERAKSRRRRKFRE